jgi:alpha-galactosidase
MRFLLLCFFLFNQVPDLLAAPTDSLIVVETQRTALVLQLQRNGDVSTIHLGKRLQNSAEYLQIQAMRIQGGEGDYTGLYNSAYTPAGGRNLLEPAIQATHADGNPALDLKYVKHETQKAADNVTLTTVWLKDPQYPFEVKLFYKAYLNVDVIEQWSSIKHTEKKNVVLQSYASANLYVSAKDYYLTHFHGDWAREMQPNEILLTEGIKVLDSKLGTRADLFQPPSFLVALNKPAQEDEGEVIAGTLAWSGNFRTALEVDPLHNLRLISGINPYASAYSLAPAQEFTTPTFLFTYSNQGTGGASRNLHQWARKYRILQGEGSRLTLLNNWEATYFDFDEQKLAGLFKDGKKLGVDLFLLDDGWFANKYPRNNDRAGLGDWQENVKKLPHGIGYLVKEAQQAGIKFGIWLEPEMVNPKSELYEKHPDWVIKLPNRSEYYFRNQLVLDLSNPKVQDFVYGIVDGIFSKNPELAYVKWDCNAVIYNVFSSSINSQANLYVDYVNGLYKVLERIRAKYPNIPMMLCSGGGGRVDYKALQYFTEYWPSDNTEPLERVFIQWNYSYFFPAIASSNHVTDWGKQPIKFRTDVAMMGKIGYDIVVSHLPEKDLQFSQEALITYKSIQDAIWHGSQYRLADPYTNDAASVMYVNGGKTQAVMFNYLVKNRYRAGTVSPVRLKGLDPAKKYTIKELNLYPGTSSPFKNAPVYSGDYLMNVGFNPAVNDRRTSVVIELSEVK